jgi:hypothetical protein
LAARPLPRHWRVSVAAFLVGLTGWVVLAEPGQTAKFLAGVLGFILAWFAPRAALGAITAGWVLACLGAIPAALLLHKLGLQDASWLQLSGQQRILVWNEIAHLVLNAPVLGVGANMTYVLHPLLHEAQVPRRGLGMLFPTRTMSFCKSGLNSGLSGRYCF